MSALSDIVAKFRKGSPNIAAAFDEVERRLVALEQPVPPPPPPLPSGSQFGGQLPARIPESSGPTVQVATVAEVSAALANPPLGGVIDGGGRTFTGSGDLWWRATPASRATTTIRNLTTDGFRWMCSGTDVRWRNVVAKRGYDGFKFEGSFDRVELDQCSVEDTPLQGILVANGALGSGQVWRTRFLRCGLTGAMPDNQKHAIYIASANGWVIASSLFVDIQSFGVQLYPEPTNALVVGNTFFGHRARGAVVFGGASGCKVVGNIVAQMPDRAIFDYDGTVNTVTDLLWFACTSGVSGPTVDNIRNADPLFVDAAAGDFRLRAGSPAAGMVEQERWGLLPAFGFDGRQRVTADAGAFVV